MFKDYAGLVTRPSGYSFEQVAMLSTADTVSVYAPLVPVVTGRDTEINLVNSPSPIANSPGPDQVHESDNENIGADISHIRDSKTLPPPSLTDSEHERWMTPETKLESSCAEMHANIELIQQALKQMKLKSSKPWSLSSQD